MTSSFADLGLPRALLVGVERLGFTELTDIQAAALPPALAGEDLVAHARTGSGKTAVFGLALLGRLDLELRRPQALVLCPTRELAQQSVEMLRALAVGLEGTRVVAVTGGAPLRAQRSALQAGAHVVVGTPGRVLKLLEEGTLSLEALRVLVLDEADRMLDMGFEEQVRAVVEHAPSQRQTLLFSATWPAEMAELSAGIQRSPRVLGEGGLVDAALLWQSVVLCQREQRADVLAGVLASRAPAPTLVFCETRLQCQEVAEDLRARGVAALALHGDLEQRRRDEVLVQLRNHSARVLVATNLAARGLDVEGLELVICYELSPDPDTHVHRVGRTARASAQGEAISLVAGARELKRLEAVEARLGAPIPRAQVPRPGSLEGWSAPMRTLVILGGRKDKLRPGDLLGALTREVGLAGEEVGLIVLTDRRCWVAVRAQRASSAARRLARGRIKGRRFRVQAVK